jgi:diguanylate cyclase (GGDEF)-like protein/PAS domain S-box-containing protein
MFGDAQEFLGFEIKNEKTGAPFAVFSRRVSNFRCEMDASGSTNYVEEYESRFDENNLIVRIENLTRQGADASMSEAALAALRRAMLDQQASAEPAMDAATLAPWAFGPVARIANDIMVLTTSGPNLADTTIAYVNPAFTRLTGYTAREVSGRSWRILCGPGTSHETVAALDATLATGQELEVKILLYPKVGRPFWFDLSVAPLPTQIGGSQCHAALVGRIAHPVGRGRHEIEDIRQRDQLTGLFDQQAILEAVAGDLQSGDLVRRRGPCIALVVIDDLDVTSAQIGGPVGDAVLLEIADRLAANVRRADVVCRLDGAEFGIYMGCIGLQEAKAGATRLQRMITSSPIPTPRGPVTVNVSVVATSVRWPRDEAEPEAIMAALLASARGALPARQLHLPA